MQADYSKEKEFKRWLLSEHNYQYNNNDNIELSKLLAAIGIKVESLFSLNNAEIIRLYASNLVLKRALCNESDFKKYKATIDLLMYYAEFLELPAKQETRSVYQKDKTRDSLIIAYALSRLNTTAVGVLGYKTFSEAFKSLGELLEQKPTTIKNMRDEFDPYFDNGRAGWYQRELSQSRRVIFDEYNKKSDDELVKEILFIISEYKNQNEAARNQKPHKTIRITNGSMKEIKAKQKR